MTKYRGVLLINGSLTHEEEWRIARLEQVVDYLLSFNYDTPLEIMDTKGTFTFIYARNCTLSKGVPFTTEIEDSIFNTEPNIAYWASPDGDQVRVECNRQTTARVYGFEGLDFLGQYKNREAIATLANNMSQFATRKAKYREYGASALHSYIVTTEYKGSYLKARYFSSDTLNEGLEAFSETLGNVPQMAEYMHYSKRTRGHDHLAYRIDLDSMDIIQPDPDYGEARAESHILFVKDFIYFSGLGDFYEARLNLIDLQETIQSILPNHDVQIHNNKLQLFIKDYDDTARDLLKYHGYKYTTRYGCEYQLGKATYGRKYTLPDRSIAESILSKLGVDEAHLDGIIVWLPRCYEETALKEIAYHTGVVGHERHLANGTVVSVRPHIRAIVK